MVGYGCVRRYASLLGNTKAAALLRRHWEEEKVADEVLGGCAEEINKFLEDRIREHSRWRTGPVKDRRPAA
jgi:ferritin-like metal-binding protein YciE